MTDSARSFALRMKSLAGLLTAVAALIVAIGGLLRNPKEKGARASYEELSVAVHDLSESVGKQHDDLVALRGYIAGRENSTTVTTGAATIATPTGTTASSATSPTSTALRPSSATSVSSSPWHQKATAPTTAPATGAPSAAPSVSPKPPIFSPKGFPHY